MVWTNILLALSILVMGVAIYVYYHPQLIIGQIQKKIYKGKLINSFEPFNEPSKKIKENGQLYITEIQYGTDYPNSYLDISYPSEEISIDRPTVIYLHGGGFFCGDKSLGDPMAADDGANRILNGIVNHGYNLVNINYALVPDSHFPIPLIQLEQAIAFLKLNEEKYSINMKNVIIFGQSAGAVLTGQYGSLMANLDYQELLNIKPSLTSQEVKLLVIDDAPFRTEYFNLKLKLMLGNYMQTMNMKNEIAKKSNAYLYINENYCSTFLTAGNTDGFPEDMNAFANKLRDYGVDYEYYEVKKEVCPLPHGYLGMINSNKYAAECFEHILNFMDRKTHRAKELL